MMVHRQDQFYTSSHGVDADGEPAGNFERGMYVITDELGEDEWLEDWEDDAYKGAQKVRSVDDLINQLNPDICRDLSADTPSKLARNVRNGCKCSPRISTPSLGMFARVSKFCYSASLLACSQKFFIFTFPLPRYYGRGTSAYNRHRSYICLRMLQNPRPNIQRLSFVPPLLKHRLSVLGSCPG